MDMKIRQDGGSLYFVCFVFTRRQAATYVSVSVGKGFIYQNVGGGVLFILMCMFVCMCVCLCMCGRDVSVEKG